MLNKRLKLIRKTLHLNQEEFGNRLGVTKASISRLESGINNLTEQMIKLICKEFNVDYLWLTTGQGKMFADVDMDIMAKIDRIMIGENETAKRVFKSFANMSADDWLVIEKIIDGLSE